MEHTDESGYLAEMWSEWLAEMPRQEIEEMLDKWATIPNLNAECQQVRPLAFRELVRRELEGEPVAVRSLYHDGDEWEADADAWKGGE